MIYHFENDTLQWWGSFHKWGVHASCLHKFRLCGSRDLGYLRLTLLPTKRVRVSLHLFMAVTWWLHLFMTKTNVIILAREKIGMILRSGGRIKLIWQSPVVSLSISLSSFGCKWIDAATTAWEGHVKNGQNADTSGIWIISLHLLPRLTRKLREGMENLDWLVGDRNVSFHVENYSTRGRIILSHLLSSSKLFQEEANKSLSGSIPSWGWCM